MAHPRKEGALIRRFLAAFALFLALLAGAWGGVALTRQVATTPGLLIGPVLDPEALHRLGMRALVLDITRSDFLSELNRGPLQVAEEDVSRILHATYGIEDTSRKAIEVHGALLDFVRGYPERPVFAVSIAEERPILADSIGRLLLAQYVALPDCGFLEDVGTLVDAAGIALFGGSGRRFFHEDHPECRPPGPIATRVEAGIREEFERTAAAGPDSIDAFPDAPEDEAFAARMGRTDRLLRGTAWPLPLLLLALGGLLAAGRLRTRIRRLGTAAGTGLIGYGAVATLAAPSRVREAFRGMGTTGHASEVWASLGRYGFERLALISGMACLVLGGSILFLALLSGRYRGRG